MMTKQPAQRLPPVSSVDYWRDIVFADAFYLRDKSPTEKSNILKIWHKDFMFGFLNFPKLVGGEVLFFRSLVRDDYKEMFSLVRQQAATPALCIEDFAYRSPDARMNIEVSRFMLQNKSLYDVAGSLPDTDSLDQACLYIRLCKYKYILDYFRAGPKPSAVVFFADMQPTEHLLSRHFRHHGVTTVTLQHGLYVDYANYNTVNKINYLHQPSEYFLSWGPSTSELIRRHHPDTKIVECGKPLIFSADPPADAPPTRPYIAILLDQKPFHAQNEQMIEIVQAYALRRDLDVRVRFHPSLPKADILAKYPELTEQLHFTDAQMVVGHTSTMIYEALELGCHVMRFASDIPAINLPKNSEFRTLDEMEAHAAFPTPSDLSRHYFTAFGAEALENYRSFFDALFGTASERPDHG
ncbi:hypothetical protein ROG8370_03518 [Roseovarius gaetbuli]|uniref:Uncharacterized protein n=1 Tax=Roseovarius gaetbuli TaxID=1356575 RepID=A0A1X7A875_9RHOB|nr:hypothetical protein [Roseovarius gaetbuli]SLN72505.1 hypothetical protein ROG8370_03518 [Roseovarius gaetbuli]